MSPCPSADQLLRWLTDSLRSPEADAVETHVEKCANCQAALEQLTAGAGTELRNRDDPLAKDTEFVRRLERQPPTVSWFRSRESASRLEGRETHSSSRPRPPLVNVPLSAGRGTATAAEIPFVLRKRLLFIAGVTWLVFAIYGATFLQLYGDLFSISAFSLMMGVIGLLVVLLWTRRLSLPQLRWVEIVLFGSMGLYFTAVQVSLLSQGWLSRMAAHDWQGVWLLARAFSFGWYAIIVLYGILIPNTWQRCAVFVGAMAVWSVLLNVAAVFQDVPIERGLQGMFILEGAVNTGLAALLATYGAHRIEVLREEAAEVRKLGQYQLKRRLGAGGMGEVFLAEHALLRRPCALKLIRPEKAGDPEHLRRFEREVQAMATLSHPNTVEIFDYGHAADGTFFYVMEYLPGLTLDELVRRQGPLPAERAVHLLRQVCGALREAHGVGLIHRDIKPSNVLVCERGGLHDVAKLLDFGLVHLLVPALDTHKLTQEGIIAGTPAYMSPEQAAGRHDLDGRSDLYSLGSVAYFLLTGRPPFVRPSAVQTLAAHLSEPVPPLARLRADVPSDLQQVVLRCLEKSPADRFRDAEALDRALAACTCAGRWTREAAANWWREQHEGKPESQDR